jgi:hypothetical protein
MNTETILIYKNSEYPHGYTTSTNHVEALELSKELYNRTGKSWYVMSGAKHWKTGKPVYFTIWTEEPDKGN